MGKFKKSQPDFLIVLTINVSGVKINSVSEVFMKKNLKTLLDECWDDIKILEKNRDYFINLATEKNQQFYIDHSITEKEYKEALDYCEFNSSVCDAEIKKLLKKSSRIIAKMGKQDLKFIKYESKKEKKLEEKQQSEKE